MMDASRNALEPDERGLGDKPGRSHGKLALALGAIAIALSLVLGFLYLMAPYSKPSQRSRQPTCKKWACPANFR